MIIPKLSFKNSRRRVFENESKTEIGLNSFKLVTSLVKTIKTN